MNSTQVTRIIRAPRQVVYDACLDPAALAKWRVPDSMTGLVHSFEKRVGGKYRMSLTYRNPSRSDIGKSTEVTDIFHGTFVQLVPLRKIVERTRFESEDHRLKVEMTVTTTLREVDGATEITILCEDIPPGIRLEDNEMGTRESLQKLSAYCEQREIGTRSF